MKLDVDTRYNAILEALENADSTQQIEAWNAYCETINDTDSCIYPMDDLPEMLYGLGAMTILQMAYYGDFCPAHDYFTFNGYGNLKSTDYPDWLICFEDLADYIERREDSLGCEFLLDVLAELAEMEEACDEVEREGVEEA